MENRNMSAGFLQTPSQSMIATVSARRRQTCLLHPYQQNEVAFCIVITIAIRKATSSYGVNHFPDQTILHSEPTNDDAYCQRFPILRKSTTRKGITSNKVCASTETNMFVQTVGFIIPCYSPKQPEDVTCPSGFTASDGNTRFRNKSFGLFVYVTDNLYLCTHKRNQIIWWRNRSIPTQPKRSDLPTKRLKNSLKKALKTEHIRSISPKQQTLPQKTEHIRSRSRQQAVRRR